MPDARSTLDVPFIIGRQYWLPRLTPELVELPCPVCYGNLAVVVTLGNGEHVAVQCEGCGKGYEGPRGYITEYAYTPNVKPFPIRSVTSMHDGNWFLASEEGHHAQWSELLETQELALAASREQMQRALDGNTRARAAKRERDLKQATWSVRYHEKCIADLERQLQWHRAKVSVRR